MASEINYSDRYSEVQWRALLVIVNVTAMLHSTTAATFVEAVRLRLNYVVEHVVASLNFAVAFFRSFVLLVKSHFEDVSISCQCVHIFACLNVRLLLQNQKRLPDENISTRLPYDSSLTLWYFQSRICMPTL